MALASEMNGSGHHMFLSLKSNDTSNPFWGSTTSTIDWCEENYVVTRYLAEMWNASSNIVYWLWPMIGMYACYQTSAPIRYYLAYFSLMVVGTGSFLFHGTLRYEAQLLDELPMVYMTCVMVYCHLHTWNNKVNSTVVCLALAAYAAITTTIHTVFKIFVLFEIAFGVLTAVHVLYGAWNVFQMTKGMKEQKTLKDLRLMLAMELVFGALAILLWANDNNHCSSIREARLVIGYPFRIALEFHAWWHLLMGFSGYISVAVSHYLRNLAEGRKDTEIYWSGGFFPIVSNKKSTKASKVE